MPDTLETARHVLELAEIIRTTDKGLLAYWDASRERERIVASGWPEEAAKELIRAERTKNTEAGWSGNDLRLMPDKPRPVATSSSGSGHS